MRKIMYKNEIRSARATIFEAINDLIDENKYDIVKERLSTKNMPVTLNRKEIKVSDSIEKGIQQLKNGAYYVNLDDVKSIMKKLDKLEVQYYEVKDEEELEEDNGEEEIISLIKPQFEVEKHHGIPGKERESRGGTIPDSVIDDSRNIWKMISTTHKAIHAKESYEKIGLLTKLYHKKSEWLKENNITLETFLGYYDIKIND